MDAQTLINGLFALAGGLGGFILKATWDALGTLRRDLAKLQEGIVLSYVRRDDFRDHAQRVETVLDRIEQKLDNKADKP